MAYYSFCKDLYFKKEFIVFNEGKMSRDMTHIEDIVSGIQNAIEYVKKINFSNFEIFNLGNANPISTLDLINKLEIITDRKAVFNFQESLSESSITHADLTKSENFLKYSPKISIDDEFLRSFMTGLSAIMIYNLKFSAQVVELVDTRT